MEGLQMENTTTSTKNRRSNQKSWGTLSYYVSSHRRTAGMIDDPSKVAHIDAFSCTCTGSCCIIV
jgi:hypothetical protein